MTERISTKHLYLIVGAFLAMLGVAIGLEQFWFLGVPIAVSIIALALFRLDLLFLLITALTPLSISVDDIGGGFGLHLPTEPLMFGLMLVFLIRVFYDGHFDSRVLKHPITLVLGINMSWILITCFTSEEPLVSAKFFISRLWFVIGFYFIATQVFRKPENITRFLWLYIVPLTGVVVYTVIMHATHQFEEKPAHWVMQPFFKDHTIYGAILAMFYPVVIAYLWSRKLSINTKILIGFVILILTLGIVLSYTRAAWVSLAVALVLLLVILARVRFWILAVLGVAVLVGLFTFQDEILMKLEKNRQDSSGDLAEHVNSISNVATDASNLERINRWSAALRMFSERPVFGFGPGSYKFHYASYQHSSQLTIISTNFGDLGNAHSEYFGPLAETGVLGLVTFLLIIGVTIYYYVILYQRVKSREVRIPLIGTLLGFTTYITHGFLNNFLDLDKASVPFWGFLAILVAIDVYHKQQDDTLEEPAGH